jgi:hypothetical protein
MPVIMSGVFALARRRLGNRGGYLAGFGAYWLICAGWAIALIGSRRAGRALLASSPPANSNSLLQGMLLIWPPLGAVTTRLIPELSTVDRQMVATSAAIAQINAAVEELFWRETYLELWPNNPWLGWIWPSIGFALWHVAPQVIHPSRLGKGRYVAASLALGLSWGYVAWSTRSIRWTTVSHVVTDASGLRNSLYFLE